jgi:PAS domain S-box-containing protein
MPVKKEIHILHLEDDSNDFELIKKIIQNEVSDCNFIRVESKEEFTSALDNKEIDLLLSDFSLPSFDGLSALQIAQDKKPDIPFIFISGHIGEERAIQALQKGAVDYVLKDKLDKLVPTIKRTLKESEEKRQRKIIEEELQYSEKKYKALFESAKDAIFILDRSQIIDCNPHAVLLFGYTKEEISSQHLFEFSPEFQPGGVKSLNRAAEIMNTAFGGNALLTEWQFINKSGDAFDTELSLNRIEILHKLYLQAIIRDITERKTILLELEKRANEMEAVIQSIPDAILIGDKTTIKKVNKLALNMFGVTSLEELNKNLNYLTDLTNLKEEQPFLKALNGITSEAEMLVGNIKTNQERIYRASAAPIILKGKIIGAVAINTDITEDKTSQQELIKAKEKAEEMNNLKSTFLKNMSHELRTPLIGIMGYTEILKEELKEDKFQEMVENINISGNRLLETLNLILDLSQMEAEDVSPELEVINIQKVLKPGLILFKNLAIKQNLYFNVVATKDEIYSKLDERMFLSVINNLISNALKYTKDGSIQIEISKEITDKNKWAIIRVIDTGIGIPRESVEIIFDEFRQVSEGNSRKFEGTGLGLTIAKKFVEKLNGEISVESEVGQGSTFTVKFPYVR